MKSYLGQRISSKAVVSLRMRTGYGSHVISRYGNGDPYDRIVSSSSSSSSSSSLRFHSTTTTTNNDVDGVRTTTATTTNTNDVNTRRIIKTLYRQLLRWSANNTSSSSSSSPSRGPDIPLTTLVPTVQLKSPVDVDAFRLEVLSSPDVARTALDDPIVARVRGMLPPHAGTTRTCVSVPIHTVRDIRGVVRSVFRLNMDDPDHSIATSTTATTPSGVNNNNKDNDTREYQKQRLSATFAALRSLNEVSDTLQSIRSQRERHSDRTHVRFAVGQVVQHQQERWRGVIAKWDRKRIRPTDTTTTTAAAAAARTSLTTKDYSTDKAQEGKMTMTMTTTTTTTTGRNRTGDDEDDEDDASIVYDIILDAGDAHGMGSSSGWVQQFGSRDLDLVHDDDLLRIQSASLRDYFTHYSTPRRRFIPNALVSYQFPFDHRDDGGDGDNDDDIDGNSNDENTTAKVVLRRELVDAIQEFAVRLERCVLDETSCPRDRGMVLLHKVYERLQSITTGDTVTTTTPSSSSSSSSRRATVKDATPSMTDVSDRIRELLQLHLEIVDVNHQRKSCKEYKPNIRFSLGDIVRHKRFGFRGVIVTWDPKPVMDVRRWDGVQDIDNPMEKPFYHIIPDPNDCIRVFGGERPARYVCEDNLESCPESERDIAINMEPMWTRTDAGFKAPNEIKYRFGEDMEDDGVTERCMTRIQDEFNSLYLLGRESTVRDPLASKLSLQRLVDYLHVVDNASDANPVQEMIKDMRKAHVRRDLRWRLEMGVSELLSGRGENAMEIYETIVKDDPDYAEAWNKLATCQYMYGKHEEAMESTKKVLALDPNHLQAIIGLGLIHFENEEYQEAVKQFRQALAIDPWSPIGAKLSMALDLLNKILIREEIMD